MKEPLFKTKGVERTPMRIKSSTDQKKSSKDQTNIFSFIIHRGAPVKWEDGRLKFNLKKFRFHIFSKYGQKIFVNFMK